MVIVILVGAGGFIGSVMRYLVGTWVNSISKEPWLPYGTLTVNAVGCLVIGLLAGFAETRDILGENTRALLLVGLLGGFTTFSAFGYETITLARDGDLYSAVANVGLQVAIGLAAVWVGLSLAHSV